MGWLSTLLEWLGKFWSTARGDRADFAAVTDMWKNLSTRMEEINANLSEEILRANEKIKKCHDERIQDAMQIAELKIKVEELTNRVT